MTGNSSSRIQLGLSGLLKCSYLPGEQEQLLFVLDEVAFNDWAYENLLAQGFRRSGNDIYRPHCPQCSACHSIRLPVYKFEPSASQRRIARKTSQIKWVVNFDSQEHHYTLYERYITARHSQGSMYPPTPAHFKQFTQCRWMQQVYLEGWLDDELVAVAVTDLMPKALSALYTFFAPELEKLSLGTAAILQQVELAKKLNKPYLYLGYQIDGCQAMNYKNRFHPHQKFLENRWQPFEKQSD